MYLPLAAAVAVTWALSGANAAPKQERHARSDPATLETVEVYAAPRAAQLVIPFTSKTPVEVESTSERHPPAILLSIDNAELGKHPPVLSVTTPGVRSVHFSPHPRRPGALLCRIVLDPALSPSFQVKQVTDPPRSTTLFITVDTPPSAGSPVETPIELSETWKKQGMKIVIIDPGHGGRFPGAVHNGVAEKDVVLDVAKRLEHLINQSDNMRAVLTRTGDYSPGSGPNRESLEERRKIAVRHKGDIFISLHCNAAASAASTAARGWELYYLSQDKCAVSMNQLLEANPADITDLVNIDAETMRSKSLLRDTLWLQGEINLQLSRELAEAIATEFRQIKAIPARPKYLQPARFDVLTTTSLNMPTVLVEMVFLTNPTDAELIKQTYYRNLFAFHLYNAVVRFFSTEKGFRPHRLSVAALTSMPQLPATEVARVAGEQRRDTVVAAAPTARELTVKHRLRRGESLYDVAARYGTTVNEIQGLNKLRGRRLSEGMVIEVPIGQDQRAVTARNAPAPAEERPAELRHVAQPGETLAHLALKYQTNVPALSAANNLRGGAIKAGDVLVIPTRHRRGESPRDPQVAAAHTTGGRETVPRAGNTVAAPSAAPPATADGKIISHTVAAGDTLIGICRRYNCTEQELRRLNNLSGDTVMLGAALRVPDRRASSGGALAKAEPPRVQSGAAAKPAAKPTEAAKPVAVAKAPAGSAGKSAADKPAEPVRVASAKPTGSALSQAVVEHTVKSGDTIFDIAVMYGASVQSIQRLNPSSSSTIKPGQTLKVPVSGKGSAPAAKGKVAKAATPKSYTVKAGDNLEKIARNNNTTVGALRKANNLKGDVVKTGQTLKLP